MPEVMKKAVSAIGQGLNKGAFNLEALSNKLIFRGLSEKMHMSN